MPFGIYNVPTSFLRLMQVFLLEQTFKMLLLVYFDDVLERLERYNKGY